MFHLLNYQKILTIRQKKYIGGSCAIPRVLLGISGTCTGTRTLMKVLESAPSDRQTNKSYCSI